MRLTADEIADLGCWPQIQFATEEYARAALERYKRYLERQRDEWVRMTGG